MEEVVLNALKSMGHTPDTYGEAQASAEGKGNDNAQPDGAEDTDDPAKIAAEASIIPKAAETPAEGAPPAETPATTEEPGITDEKLLELLSKRGISISSIDELKKPAVALTAEEKQEQEKRIRDEAIAYGLQNKKISKAELDALAVDQSLSNEGIAKIVFAQKLKELDPNIRQDEIDARFNEWSMTGEEDGNWHKKMRQSEIAQMRDAYINEKYNKVLGITDEYRKELEEKQRVATYNSKIDHAINSLPEKLEFGIPVTNADGTTETKTYTYQIPKETRQNVKAEFLKPETYQLLGKESIDEANLALSIQHRAMQTDFNRIIATIANSHASEILANSRLGRKGVVPDRDAVPDMEEQSLAALHPAVAAKVKELRPK